MLVGALTLSGAPSVAGARAAPDRARAFVSCHHGFVTRVLWSEGVPRDALDDAVQRVFMVAIERLTEIRDERAFLFGVASRVARETVRAARRHAVAENPDLDELQASSELRPDELLDKKRAQVLLDSALLSLPADVRTVFVLYEIEQLTLKEIANATELPQGTVASRLRRGRELFHEAANRIRARLSRGGVT